MDLQDQVVVVTGGGRGIGAALCHKLRSAHACNVIVADRDAAAAASVAAACDGMAVPCDVGNERDVESLIGQTLSQFGRIDLFCSNAGITVKGGIECPNADWQRLWDVNVMSRLYAARHVLPTMLDRGGGCLLHIASAAGLLTEIGSAAYSVTKHADVALAEWLNVRYAREGIRVSCVCPLGVETDMLDRDDPIHRFLQLQSISADEAADAILDGLRAERFLILPHPDVAEFFARKATNYDQWLRGMQRLRQKLAQGRSARVQRAA